MTSSRPDHTGGNENLGDAGVLIIAHDNVRKRLQEGLTRPDGRVTEPAPEAALPVVTFSNTTTFYWNGHELHVFHVDNAHTDGDSMVFIKDVNVLHMGDVFFNGSYPYIDLDSGGSLDARRAAAGARPHRRRHTADSWTWRGRRAQGARGGAPAHRQGAHRKARRRGQERRRDRRRRPHGRVPREVGQRFHGAGAPTRILVQASKK